MDGMLSQEEINALLSGMSESSGASSDAAGGLGRTLSDAEKDAVGEVSNISMGTAATTLSSLLNQKVSITTPQVTYSTWDGLMNEYKDPCVFIQIYYTSGLDGNNILILREHDVKVITSLMMGRDGEVGEGELTELELSAISEAMNQMMGSASTSLSSMLDKKIDISPPTASLVKITQAVNASEIADFLSDEFVNVKFKMEIGNLVDSEIMQMYSFDFAQKLYEQFMNYATGGAPATDSGSSIYSSDSSSGYEGAASAGRMDAPVQEPASSQPAYGQPQYQQPPQMAPMAPVQGVQAPVQGYPMPPVQDVNIAPVQFQPFAQVNNPLLKTENIDLLLDVPLEVTAELGRTSKSIKEILDFAPGTIIELNRLAGEPVDVLVNGKFVARGEVVVIEEAFGIRVTEVIK